MGKKKTKKLKKQKNQVTNQGKRKHEHETMKRWLEEQRKWQEKSNVFFYCLVILFISTLILAFYLLSDNVRIFTSG